MRVTIFDDTNSSPVAGLNTAANKFNAWVQTKEINVISVQPVITPHTYTGDYGQETTFYCMLLIEWVPYVLSEPIDA